MSRRGSGGATKSTESTRHLRVAAADDVLEIDGEHLPLRPRRRLPRWLVWTATFTAVLAGIASLLIVPTRTWLNQRAQYQVSHHKLDAVQKANAQLNARIEALQTDEELERLARERYNLVKAGDQVLAVLPSPAPNPLPPVWPYTLLADLISLRLTHPESIPVPSTVPVASTTAGPGASAAASSSVAAG